MDKQNCSRLRPILALCARRTRRRTTDWCGRPPVRAATDERNSDEHLNIRSGRSGGGPRAARQGHVVAFQLFQSRQLSTRLEELQL